MRRDPTPRAVGRRDATRQAAVSRNWHSRGVLPCMERAVSRSCSTVPTARRQSRAAPRRAPALRAVLPDLLPPRADRPRARPEERPGDHRGQPPLVPRPVRDRDARAAARSTSSPRRSCSRSRGSSAGSSTRSARSRSTAAPATTPRWPSRAAILERGDGVMIFPEGTRVRPGPLGRPRRGVGRLALETGAAVVPVAVIGTDEVRRGWRIYPRRVRVRAGAPLRFPQVDKPSAALAKAVTDRVWPCVELQWEWLGGTPPLRRVAIVGAGSWGTSLAVALARSGVEVELGCRTEEQARARRAQARVNARYLPGVALPETIRVTPAADLDLRAADLVCLAVPTRDAARRDGADRRPPRRPHQPARALEGPRRAGRRAARRLLRGARRRPHRRLPRRPGPRGRRARARRVARRRLAATASSPRAAARASSPTPASTSRRRATSWASSSRASRRTPPCSPPRRRRCSARTPPAPPPARSSPRSPPTPARSAGGRRRGPASPAPATSSPRSSRPTAATAAPASCSRAACPSRRGRRRDRTGRRVARHAAAARARARAARRARSRDARAGRRRRGPRQRAGVRRGRHRAAAHRRDARGLRGPGDRLRCVDKAELDRRFTELYKAHLRDVYSLLLLPGRQPPRRRGPDGADLPAGLPPLRARAARVRRAAAAPVADPHRAQPRREPLSRPLAQAASTNIESIAEPDALHTTEDLVEGREELRRILDGRAAAAGRPPRGADHALRARHGQQGDRACARDARTAPRRC